MGVASMRGGRGAQHQGTCGGAELGCEHERATVGNIRDAGAPSAPPHVPRCCSPCPLLILATPKIVLLWSGVIAAPQILAAPTIFVGPLAQVIKCGHERATVGSIRDAGAPSDPMEIQSALEFQSAPDLPEDLSLWGKKERPS